MGEFGCVASDFLLLIHVLPASALWTMLVASCSPQAQRDVNLECSLIFLFFFSDARICGIEFLVFVGIEKLFCLEQFTHCVIFLLNRRGLSPTDYIYIKKFMYRQKLKKKIE
jgi:hypothetical protein